MQNELAKRALHAYDNEQKKLSRLDAGIKEANLTYFAFLLLNAFSVLIIPVSMGALNVNLCITLSIVLLLFSIPLFVVAYKLGGKNTISKSLYYLNFIFISASILMSGLAIMIHYNATISINHALMVAVGILFLAVLDLIVLSTGKFERLCFSLMSAVFLAAIIFAIYILSLDALFGMGIVMLVFSCALFTIHLSMLIYICSGEGFFALMSFTYLILAIIVLIVALLIISNGDCSGDCDIVDCFPNAKIKGGRRGKTKIYNIKGSM